jgi:parvulin-like peptidyl-prolyl isomerase
MKSFEYLATCALLVLALSSVSACSSGGGDSETSASGASTLAQTGSERTGEPQASQEAAPEVPAELSAAHILIMYKGSARSPATVTRTKEEALKLAKSIAEKAAAPDGSFSELAKQYSDCPSGPRGGDLGRFAPDRMVKPFTDALLGLEVGEISDVVETQFGYHVIKRQQVTEVPMISARHILVMYKGALQAPGHITRTKEEARTRIQDAMKRVSAGESFEDLAREYSDCPSSASGGDLGEFPRGVMVQAFDEAAFACEVGKVTDIVETPFGFHIIYRYE